jgi:antitoxin HicB
MRYAYPYELSLQAEGGFTVTFPDIPEAITEGETEAEAAKMAEDALVTALSFYTANAEPLPPPSPSRERTLAYVPVLVAAKLALHDAMLAERVSNVDLARRLGVDEKIVRRLRDPLHKSRIEKVDAALRSLGKIIALVVGNAAPARPKPLLPPQLLYDRTQARNRRYSSRSGVVSGFHCAQGKYNSQRVISRGGGTAAAPGGNSPDRRRQPR